MRIAMVSMDQQWEAPAANRAACQAHARRAVELGADVIVFPELTLTGFTMDPATFAEPPDASGTVAAFAALATEVGAHIAFGVPLHGARRPRNTLVLVSPDGREVARYAKLHPFTFAGEDRAYEGGDGLVMARMNDAAFGLAVCYDLRFPGMFAALAPHCDALLVIANWPGRRIQHWEALLRARAIEGQCFAVGVNRTGTDGNGVEYPRSSVAFAPDGSRLEPESSDDVVDIVSVDPAVARRYRASFPVLPDARPHEYRLQPTATGGQP
jgi:predicted amidohydrolase